jgi:hypothetical protein
MLLEYRGFAIEVYQVRPGVYEGVGLDTLRSEADAIVTRKLVGQGARDLAEREVRRLVDEELQRERE